MSDYGFIRTAAAVPVVKVADTAANTEEICRLTSQAVSKGVSLIAFPELAVTGCSCGDLFFQNLLLTEAEAGIRKIIEFSRGKDITIVTGSPLRYRSRLYDCAVVIRNGNIKGIVPKTYADDNRVFSSGADFLSADARNDGPFLDNGKDFVREGFPGEIRYAGQRCNISPNLLFCIGKMTFAIEVGTDFNAPVRPSSLHVLQGAHVIVNPGAGNEVIMTDRYRKTALGSHTSTCLCGYIHVSSGYGESSQDHVYAGGASIWETGCMLAENERFQNVSSLTVADIDIEKIETLRQKSPIFSCITPDGKVSSSFYRLYSRARLGAAHDTDFSKELYRHVEPHPFVPADDLDYRCREILSLQVTALMKRLSHINCRTAVIGISGGLDSTLAMLATVMAFDRLGWNHDRIVAVTMPGFGTTSRTKNNAWDLMQALGVTCREIPIGPAVSQHFNDIGHDASVHDATYENSQARERTQILMDIANQTGGIVIGTGDLSELALGWATYNGDHMSMYGVNAGVPKTLVQSLVRWAAENKFSTPAPEGRSIRDILIDIVDTPISPELLPASDNDEIQQVTEDLVGPYELHDFFIYNFIRFGFSPEKILFLAEKAFKDLYDTKTIRKWLQVFVRRFFSQQFKRSCLPDGPKVGSVGLSPRGDLVMPSDALSTLFTNEINSI